MTLKEIFPTTIYSVKLMHDCIAILKLGLATSKTVAIIVNRALYFEVIIPKVAIYVVIEVRHSPSGR